MAYKFVKYENAHHLTIDTVKFCIICKESEDLDTEFMQYDNLDALNEAVNEIKNNWENTGVKIVEEGVYPDSETSTLEMVFTFAAKKLIGKNKKPSKENKVKEENPYKKMDKEKIKKEYYSIANNELPKLLANGFVKAIQKYQKDGSNENEICCILDISKKSAMVFVYGDGSECENDDDETVFYKYSCDETLYKCKSMVEEIETLNLGQESTHWLEDAIKLAENQKIFEKIKLTIYGNVQYGRHELDVIYEK